MLQIIMYDCMKSAIDRGKKKQQYNVYDAHSKSNKYICGQDGKELEI